MVLFSSVVFCCVLFCLIQFDVASALGQDISDQMKQAAHASVT